MSRKARRLVRLLALVHASIMLVALLAAPAFASIAPRQYVTDLGHKNFTIYIRHKNDTSNYFEPDPDYYAKSGKVSKVTSSNTKVIDASVRKNGKILVLEAKRWGKSTITYKYKGKTYKVVVKVRYWKNPVKKLMVGNKNKTSWFNSHSYLEFLFDDAKGKKLSIQPASGWKILSIKQRLYHALKDVSVKNNSKITEEGTFYIVLQNTKTGGRERVEVAAYNDWD